MFKEVIATVLNFTAPLRYKYHNIIIRIYGANKMIRKFQNLIAIVRSGNDSCATANSHCNIAGPISQGACGMSWLELALGQR